MISEENSIFINKLAQQIIDVEVGCEWFNNLDFNTQLDVLRSLSLYVLQAGAKESDVVTTIDKVKLKKTYTPCVLIQKGALKVQLNKILNLPHDEYSKIFLLLLTLFSLADERRRKTKCKNKCSHWWHNLTH